VECPCWDGVLKIDGLCYYHAKLTAHLLRSSDGTNGHVGSLTLEQERFIGLEDPDTSGAWDHTAIPASDLLSWLLEQEAITGLDRRVPGALGARTEGRTTNET
jgi:hypothetical protein